jgi:hypothetical protein
MLMWPIESRMEWWWRMWEAVIRVEWRVVRLLGEGVRVDIVGGRWVWDDEDFVGVG